MKYNKGGSPEWVEVFKTDGPVCKAKIGNLKEETEVEFRVIAENKGNFLAQKKTSFNLIFFSIIIK